MVIFGKISSNIFEHIFNLFNLGFLVFDGFFEGERCIFRTFVVNVSNYSHVVVLRHTCVRVFVNMSSEEDSNSESSNNSSENSDSSSSDGAAEVLVGEGEDHAIMPWRFEPVGRRREAREVVEEEDHDERHERLRNSNWYV